MRYLFEIRHDIEKRYKDGDDWVYAKGKKAEIDLIKELYEKCVELDKKVFDLRDELDVLDPWEAYRYAENELNRVHFQFERVAQGMAAFEEGEAQWNKAKQELNNADAYLKKILKGLSEKEGEDESKDQTDT